MLSYSKISNPLLKPFKTSFGTQLTRDAIILSYREGETRAFAEAVTDEAPLYGYEDNFTVLHVINNHLKGMFSPDLEPDRFNEKAKEIRGHNMAKGVMEMLLWDINAKREGKPLHKFLGKSKGHADVGISIGMSTIEDELKTIEDSVKRGYRRIKVKIERGYNVELIKAIRDRFGDIPLSVDANQGFSRNDFKILKKLDEFNLKYIEQPLPLEDINGHALLRKELKTPICLDESIESVESALNAIERGAVDVINIKPGRVGGLQNSLDIMEKAKENDVKIWIGGMLETGIGRSFNISLASNALVNMPGDTSPNSRYFKKDITNELFEMNDGRITPHKGNGTGITLDYEFFNRVQVEGGRLLD
jgi:O-succinylbenzoate synthase